MLRTPDVPSPGHSSSRIFRRESGVALAILAVMNFATIAIAAIAIPWAHLTSPSSWFPDLILYLPVGIVSIVITSLSLHAVQSGRQVARTLPLWGIGCWVVIFVSSVVVWGLMVVGEMFTPDGGPWS
ncbi:hypothetical protein [Lysinibacter cavernae]|uniref:CDP-diglyceride synthetase n=1 Tax=Lysinibacter cavernae TaxID=1640652 RepID=A0A7X5R4H4_9MICO|nr:hypothetical protein [Lysinibacter cavernae]NIH55217.1 CDP-diglyceride synthetase [Lysinibacter cavernae]